MKKHARPFADLVALALLVAVWPLVLSVLVLDLADLRGDFGSLFCRGD